MGSTSQFFRDVLRIASGTTAGQLVSLLLSVLVTRLYTPEMFGSLEQFAMLIGLFSALACGKYEAAIMLPEKEEDGHALLRLSLALAVIVSLLLGLGLFFFREPVARALHNPAIGPWLWLAGPATFLLACKTALGFWFSRNKSFSAIGLSKFLFPVSSEPTKLIAGTWGFGLSGLFAGIITGHLLSSGFLLFRYFRLPRPPQPVEGLHRMKELAKSYRDYPRYSVPGGLLNRLAQWLHVALFGWLFGSDGLIILGFFALSRRVVMVPLNTFGAAFAQVYYQHITQLRDGHSLYRSYRKMMVTFSLASLALIVLIQFIPDDAIGWVFGSRWAAATPYLKILIFWYSANFTVGSLAFMLHRIRKQKHILMLDSLHLVLITIALLAAWFWNADLLTTTLCFVAGKVLYFAIQATTTLSLLKQHTE